MFLYSDTTVVFSTEFVQWYSAGLRVGWSGVWVTVESKKISPHHHGQVGCGQPILLFKG